MKSNHSKQLARIAGQLGGNQARLLLVPQILIRFTGSIDGALLLSQIIYWSDRTPDPAGWFYKSYADWTEELSLGEFEVRKHSRLFEEMGFLETKKKRVPPLGNPVKHYRLKWTAFLSALAHFFGVEEVDFLKEGNAEESGGEVQKVSLPEASPSRNGAGINSGTLKTEMTAEMTAEMTGEGEKQRRSPALSQSQDLAVELYREMAGLPAVSETIAGLIREAKIETERELEFWQEVVRHWLGCGWSPKNVAGMLDYYRRAEVPSTRERSRPGSSRSPTAYRFGRLADFGLSPGQAEGGEHEADS